MPLERSGDDIQLQDKKSYRVKISEGGKSVVVEARLTLGTLETLKEPEKFIQAWFTSRPLTKANAVIDVLPSF